MNVKKRTAYAELLIDKRPSLAVPWYLGLSWLYYVWDVSLVEDHAFDAICLRLLHDFDRLEHRHKGLIQRDALTAGTGFYLSHADIPTICRNAFGRLAIEDGHFVRRGRSYVRAP